LGYKAWLDVHVNHTNLAILVLTYSKHNRAIMFEGNRLCWVHPMKTVVKKLQLMMSTIWLV